MCFAETCLPSISRSCLEDGCLTISLFAIRRWLRFDGRSAESVEGKSASSTMEAPSDIVIVNDVDYATDAPAETMMDSSRNQLDVYHKRDIANAPCLIHVHGGMWCVGDKSTGRKLGIHFASKGFVVLCINTRLLPECELSDFFMDGAKAVAWALSNVRKFGGDPDRILLSGHSAGAHMVSLLGTNDAFLRQAGVSAGLRALRGVVSLDSNMYNVAEQIENTNEYRTVPFKFHAVRQGRQSNRKGGDESAARIAAVLEVSPYHQVRPGMAIPPFLLFISDGRPPGPTVSFAEKLTSSGFMAGVVTAVGKNHGSLMADCGSEGDATSAQIEAFAKSVCAASS